MKTAKYYLVYEIRNILNNNIYIGVHATDNINDCYMGSGLLIRKAITKYGESNFVRTVLFFCSSSREMYKKESEIVTPEFIKRADVYNECQGGNGFQYGHQVKEETRARIRNSQIGRKFTEEHKEKMMIARIGRRLSDEHKLHIGIKSKGKKHTEETKLKMRLCKLGKKHTEEARLNMRNSHVGKKMTEESKKKLSQIMTGRKVTEEFRNKMSEIRKRTVLMKRAESLKKGGGRDVMVDELVGR